MIFLYLWFYKCKLNCCKCFDKCKKKDDLRKPFFILYCDKCKIFFKDEKKYNKHLSKYHGEN